MVTAVNFSTPFTISFINVTLNSTSTCVDWQDGQHFLFQLSNLCFAVSFLAPNSFRYHSLFLRILLSLGYTFYVIWAGVIICLPELLAWTLGFLAANVIHVLIIIYRLYPVMIRTELEEVYVRLFKPIRVSRGQFRELSKMGDMLEFPRGSYYAIQGTSHSGRKVALLITGRMKVTCDGLFLHYVEPNQFIDSPEYEATATQQQDDTYQVSISSVEDSQALVWPIKDLLPYLKSRSFISSVFTNLMGKDITIKLYQMQELLLSNPDYMQALASHSSSMVNVRSSLAIPSNNTSTLDLFQRLNDLQKNNAEQGKDSSADCIRTATPEGPYSPSMVSFETCV